MATGADQAIKPSRVLLTGASSQIGVFAIPRLIEAGFHVIAVSRKGRPDGFPVYDQVQWVNQADSVEAADSCQYLLSTGPMHLAKRFLANGGQLQSVVVFSSSSVESKQTSGNPQEKKQIGEMLTLESELRHEAKTRNLKLVIFRPTLIYGCGLDTNISLLAKWIRRFGFIPVNGRAAGLRQPVHADDLAAVAVTAMLSEKVGADVLSLAGGDTLSYSEMIARIFTALGKPARLLRLPEWLFVLMANLVGGLIPGSEMNGEMVKRQKLDLVFDDSLARELFDYDPRPFEPVGGDFTLPDFQAHLPTRRHRAGF